MKILLIDDEQDYAFLLEMAIAGQGRIDYCNRVVDLNKFSGKKYDFVVMDYEIEKGISLKFLHQLTYDLGISGQRIVWSAHNQYDLNRFTADIRKRSDLLVRSKGEYGPIKLFRELQILQKDHGRRKH